MVLKAAKKIYKIFMKNFMEKYNVSRETFDLLKTYEASLQEWQQKFNLVSNSSLAEAWNRHFADSAQLFSYIPSQARVLLDFGSGAGFPGMVLAIMAKEKTPYLKVKLVESIAKKTLYLKHVAEICGLDVEILHDRIENLEPQKADVITSRAMASLEKLLEYTYPFCKKETQCIFPKGRSYKEELAQAQKKWRFSCQIEPNRESAEGKILIITDITRKGVK